jgi:hypothetical protein
MNFKYSFFSNLLSTIFEALSIGCLETSFGKLSILFLMVCTWGSMSVLRVKEADLEVLSYVLALLAIPRAGGALGFGGRAIYFRSISKTTDSLFCLHRVQKNSN